MVARKVDFTCDPNEVRWKVAKSHLVVSTRMMALHGGRSNIGSLSPFKLTRHIVFGPWLCPTRMTLLSLLRMTRRLAGIFGSASVVSELSYVEEAGDFYLGEEVFYVGYDGESRNVGDVCVR